VVLQFYDNGFGDMVIDKSTICGERVMIGIIFIMVGFGAAFGYTVMARISLLIGRLQFLLGDWLGIIQ